jgi:antitoxin (DNA-binding transcriptional repressor) of toxin-antitoxin stability system
MIEMSVTDFARNLGTVFDRIEHNGEQIILRRNKHRIARIIPGSPYLTAQEAMGDLYRTISDEADATWFAENRLASTLKDDSYNPWES